MTLSDYIALYPDEAESLTKLSKMDQDHVRMVRMAPGSELYLCPLSGDCVAAWVRDHSRSKYPLQDTTKALSDLRSACHSSINAPKARRKDQEAARTMLTLSDADIAGKVLDAPSSDYPFGVWMQGSANNIYALFTNTLEEAVLILQLIDSCHPYVDPDQDLKPLGFHSMR